MVVNTTLAISMIIDEVSLVLIPAVVSLNTKSVALVCQPVTIVKGLSNTTWLVSKRQFSFALLHFSVKITFIDIAIIRGFPTLAMLLAFAPIALIESPMAVGHLSVAGEFTSRKLSIEDVLTSTDKLSTSLSLV